jgi:hypothetical protein
VEALVRAGLVCRFYEGTVGLEPDEAELGSLMSNRTRALLLIHYLGFPQDGLRWRRWCDASRVLLIEDAAQAWLASVDGTAAGSSGDVSIFCLYRTFGLSEGAALVGPPSSEPAGRGARPLGFVSLARRHAAWIRSRSGLLGSLGGRTARTASAPAEEFALGDPVSRPSRMTTFLLPRVAHADAAGRRRENYALLLERLSDAVAAPFARLPPTASPFVFPLETTAKGLVLTRLAEAGIAAFDFWSVAHPTLPKDAFPRTEALRGRIVGLPVHQELRLPDLERIADTARGALDAVPAPVPMPT